MATRAILGVGLVLFSAPAVAVQEFCVSSAAGLETVLEGLVETWYESDPDIPEAAVVKIQTGLYQDVEWPQIFTEGIACDVFYGCYDYRVVGYGPLTIEGGYSAGCVSRASNPSATLVLSSSLRLQAHGGALHLENLALAVPVGTGPASLYAKGEDLILDRVRFEGFRVSLTGREGATLQVTNSQITGAANGLVMGGRSALVADLEDATLDLAFTTVAGNTTDHGVSFELDSATLGGAVARMSNTIVWGHTESDLANLQPWVSKIYLLHNVFAGYEGPAPQLELGTIAADPMLAAGTLALNAGSPAIDAATGWVATGLPAVDFVENPRPSGAYWDIGAYERQIAPLPVVTVTNTNDSGPGSLRDAIAAANGGADLTEIRFALPGACTNNVITLVSLLPDVTTPIVVDGFTQTGSKRNTVGIGANDSIVCVGLSGADALAWGFHVPEGDADARLDVRGLSLRRFTDAAIKLDGGTNHQIRGSRFSIGLGAASTAVPGGSNRRHVVLSAGATYSLVGGSSPGDRNVLALAEEEAIRLSASILSADDVGRHLVLNNYIGTDADGEDARPNGVGILVTGRDNFIESNVISGNDGDAVRISGSEANGNRIYRNTIGLKKTNVLGPTELPNGGSGVHIVDGDGNRITSNRIANNESDGVTVVAGSGNPIRANSIYANQGQGIDLGDDGADVNDNDGALQPTGAPNRHLNYPVIERAVGRPFSLELEGYYESIDGQYQIDVFSQAVGSCDDVSNGQVNGEGRTFEGAFAVTIADAAPSSNGRVDFDVITLATRSDYTGLAVTLVATAATGNSSEFSACIPLLGWEIFADGFESGSTSAWSTAVP